VEKISEECEWSFSLEETMTKQELSDQALEKREAEKEARRERKQNLNRLDLSILCPCGACLYWDRQTATSGNCRRYPLRAGNVALEPDEADRWQVTFDDDYCGEFKSAERRP
jgi:hypothetical protein